MMRTGRGRPGRGPRPGPILLALALVLACGGRGDRPEQPRRPVHLSLPALDGGEIDVARYRGRVVVLHAFTTWSMASQADVEQLIAAHAAHPDQVVIIGLALDPDGYRLVAPWRRAMRVPYLITLAPPAIRGGRSPLGKIAEVPTTILLGRDGTIVRRVERELEPRELDQLLADLVPTE